MTAIESFNSVWDAIADTPEQAANLPSASRIDAADCSYHQGKRLEANRGCNSLSCHPATYQRFVAWTCIPIFVGCVGKHRSVSRPTRPCGIRIGLSTAKTP